MNKRDHFIFSHPTTEFLTIALISLSLMGPALAESPPPELFDVPAEDAISVGNESVGGLSNMLPFLITSPDRQRLAADLLSSLERGDLQKAEKNLNAAIEAGTLAIALIDRLHDPDLRSSLESLGLAAGQQPQPASLETCSVPTQTTDAGLEANLAEMQEALDQEQAHGSMVSKELASLTGQYNALTARLKSEAYDTALRISELERVLQQERQQRAAAMQEFASLQTEYRKLQDSAGRNSAATSQDVSRLEEQLKQERERSGSMERDLAAAQEDARRLQSIRDKEAESRRRIAELENLLSQAQARSDGLAHELAGKAEALHSLQEAQKRNAAPSAVSSAAGKAEAASPVLQQPAPVVIAQLPAAIGSFGVSSIGSAPSSSSTMAVPAPEPAASSPAQELKADDRLTERADELFRNGDVSGARLLLEHLLKAGNPRAAFLLAETFDPQVLSRLGVRGIRGDTDKAREYYAQAQALGMTQASERMKALK